jgi:hypothetical protein
MTINAGNELQGQDDEKDDGETLAMTAAKAGLVGAVLGILEGHDH